MVPDLQPQTKLPHGAMDLGSGYILLRARDKSPQEISAPESAAILGYVVEHSQAHGGIVPEGPISMKLTRWARLRLPNGQVARSAWKENLKTLKHIRIACNIKVS